MIKRLAPMAALIGGTILSMVAAPDSAWAEKRVALIVGNSSYQTVPQLTNPSMDANAVAKMFRDAGFDSVDVQINVGNLEFKRSIRKFEATADQADIAVVYYAGHGLEIGGTNYLIPVDARLASDRDADDEAIRLERLVSSADGARRLRLIILDACRDNPFVTIMRRERKVANRAVVGGLGKVEPTSTDTLIAYAAKAGSTAADGDGQHSPFTTAVLKNLTVPGLDVRLAFGRVRDEVLKTTSNRQEPFVYGSLGGGNIALVPAPAVPQQAPVSDIRADYELVQRIGSRRAWEVFLGTHPTGFYADLARAQIQALNTQSQPASGNITVVALPSPPAPSNRETPSKEALEWDSLKDSTDPAALEKFIKRYPNSPLSINAQQRMDVLNKAAQEREEKARAEREAAKKAAEEALRQAEQRKAEFAAAKKREDDERRVRAAEAEAKAKAAAAELAVTKKREEDERRAKAAEAEQMARAAEAERKAAEAKQKAEEAERQKAAAEAAALRAASEKQAREAAEEALRQAEQRKAELAAAKKREDDERRVRAAETEAKAAAELAVTKKREKDERRAKAAEAEQKAKAAEAERKAAEAKQEAEEAERKKAAAEAAALRAASEKQAREAEAARKKADLAAAHEAACKNEQGKLEELTAKGSEGSGSDDLKAFSRTVTCDRLGPLLVATLDKFNTEAAKRAASLPNSPGLVRSAQTQLVRLGCMAGKIDGTLNAPTKSALGRYLTIEGQPSENASVTEALVAELTKHATRACPVECKSGESLKGETCVANEKPAAPATASRKKDDDEDDARPRRKQSNRQPEREARRPRPAPEAPLARQEAVVARPSIVSGGGGSHTMIGVGF